MSHLLACGENQHYDPCGTSCPANCSNFRDPIICTEDCRPGCFCNEGYVFHMVLPNLCVEENQCPIEREGEYSCDKPHRELNRCGTACPKTCANRNDSVPCIKPCVIGCFCAEGYLSNRNGDCVLEAECDDVGDMNECSHDKNKDFLVTRLINDEFVIKAYIKHGQPDRVAGPELDDPRGILDSTMSKPTKRVALALGNSCANGTYSDCGSPCAPQCDYHPARASRNGLVLRPVLCPAGKHAVTERSVTVPQRVLADAAVNCDEQPANFGLNQRFSAWTSVELAASVLLAMFLRILRVASYHKIARCPPPFIIRSETSARRVSLRDGRPSVEDRHGRPSPTLTPLTPCLTYLLVTGQTTTNSQQTPAQTVANNQQPPGQPSASYQVVTGQTTTATGQSTTSNCGENQVYNDCGSACPPNCTNFNPPPVCNKACARGCFCKEGYLEDDTRACVPQQMCESCTGNTTFSNCGSSCPERCDAPPNPNEPCNLQCVIGCVCKTGFVHVSGTTGPCVLRSDCPRQYVKQ
ncbi:uncharacterized protein LOC128469752 [Spea bombifrons]|uniref:uncharacterized protein LOC128469752 n=1 Tax=Spea bombifrons TaxID=233779 RepID=UPI002348F9C8|nr:uncharacterized protein LOC128469752 [Spea bombifrons]